MKETKYKIIALVALVILSIMTGFFIGRSTIEQEHTTVVKYQKGERVTDSISYPVPVNVTKPIDTANIIKQCVKDGIYSELFPDKTVIEYIEITKEDTSKILEDWATKRYYSEKLFDIDTLGSCTVDVAVQYNRILLLEYSYLPVTKVVTHDIYKTKTFSPFIGGGLIGIPTNGNLMLGLSVDGGVFIKEKYGVKLQYGHMFDLSRYNLYGLSFVYKF